MYKFDGLKRVVTDPTPYWQGRPLKSVSDGMFTGLSFSESMLLVNMLVAKLV